MGSGIVCPWVSGWVCIEEGGSGRGDVRRPQLGRCSGYVLQSREAEPRGRLPAYSRDLERGGRGASTSRWGMGIDVRYLVAGLDDGGCVVGCPGPRRHC